MSSPGERLRQLPGKLDRQFNAMAEPGFDGRGLVKVRAPRDKPDLAYRLFIRSLGDDENHSQLKAALMQVDDAAARRFLGYLFDQRKRRTPIETLAKMAGIGIPRLRDIWRQARLDEGLLALLNEYPRTMKDVARDSRSTREMCKPCGGTGRIVDDTQPPTPSLIKSPRNRREDDIPTPVYISCAPCGGKGWIRKAGDKDARALMGQILGVSGKTTPLFSSTVTNITLESVINDIELMGRQSKAPAGIYEGTAESVEPEASGA